MTQITVSTLLWSRQATCSAHHDAYTHPLISREKKNAPPPPPLHTTSTLTSTPHVTFPHQLHVRTHPTIHLHLPYAPLLALRSLQNPRVMKKSGRVVSMSVRL
ncbi:hypothetical protein COCVIDRAFT_84510 [Bipolaris victoriae FI3]|uniref:Uncharacterized protein n=1 Tax=Bipolaris victoriae (strain FI3) TaxID=930091 RepID=W7FAL8_BIPV3|nr:hypothetical protein COCVIDRAFT_84510 [Bipolaris victoriae FI3]